jgi:Ca-activated chloride channel homolog
MLTCQRGRFGLICIILLCFATHLNSQNKKSAVPSFKADVNTVYIKIAVTDPMNRYVAGLERDQFRIYEDNIEQTILYFSDRSGPVSLGYVCDTSSSMGFHKNIKLSKRWFKGLLTANNVNPEDEYFLITFNNSTKLVEDYTSENTQVENDIAIQKTGGSTALFDALYMALNKAKEGKNERKAIILISDGEENHSIRRMADIRRLAEESNVQVYSIGLLGPEQYGVELLESIADFTGGRVFVNDPREPAIDLEYIVNLIHSELRNQYLLSYSPTNSAKDGKWRQITVKLDAPSNNPGLSIRARKGYYAPKY